MGKDHLRKDQTNEDSASKNIMNDPPSSLNEDEVFKMEQAHLSHVYAKLLELADEVTKKMSKTAEDAQDDKRMMAEEISVNLANYADAMETYADFVAMNRIVDMANASQRINAQKLADITLLLKQPYFAKVVLKFPQFDEPREFYIGSAGISDKDCKKLVIDWRSPIAEVYYNQGTGPTSYEANGRTIQADLLLRRQFDICEDRLLACFDTTIAIQDPLLLASLSEGRSDAMRAITATIQKEQNAIIRHDDVPTLLVIGAAGSGKTSVMMQRIAYLFYQQRESLRPEEAVLITPNMLFQRYISSVLPELGEENPRIAPWRTLLKELLPERRGVGRQDVAPDRLEAIDRALEDFEFEIGDFRPIEYDGVRLIGTAPILKLIEKHRNVPAGSHRIVLVQEEIAKRIETRLSQIASHEDTYDDMAALPLDDQIAQFGTPFTLLTEDEIPCAARKFVQKRFASVLDEVENFSWIDIDHIGARLLERHGLTTLERLYLKMGVTGLSDPTARYVMIDEVQDYTAAQLMIIERYFRNAHFLLLGDPNQAIEPNTVTFDQICSIFARTNWAGLREEVCEVFLPTSYRCTPQITELFAGLAKTDVEMTISSVQREGADPLIMEFADDESYEVALFKTFCCSESVGTKAFIVNDEEEAKRLYEKFEKAWIQKAMTDPLPDLVVSEGSLQEQGAVIIPLRLAKGLEFDAVVIVDASEEAFPPDDLSQRRLYTAISRATRELTILSKGPLTPILRHALP